MLLSVRLQLLHFNPRSREGSDQGSTTGAQLFDVFQSTLPRRERQDGKGYFRPAEDISIHAPAKGATKTEFEGIKFSSISIHAPAKGAT